ncbi:hypothetical protein BDDG_12810 [Blastomyces dermatitidis ATCC 18188]|uniref:Uncharacterized protein n=1 Tax=Ajellomyces dermatitidis (strain ATCC 18188 / CBS 674.68) TaxID=653446 RepID=A0A0J9HH13_AJEDA|nr:hypothetical protein BDDG_12810 [Blastomyces dermatitidis ATCC 18188]
MSRTGCSDGCDISVRRYGTTRNLRQATLATGFPGRPKNATFSSSSPYFLFFLVHRVNAIDPGVKGTIANGAGWPGRMATLWKIIEAFNLFSASGMKSNLPTEKPPVVMSKSYYRLPCRPCRRDRIFSAAI